ncbi:hypothetical protein A5N15_01605 [Rothia kristinae]|uniref:PRC-barrel domain-containing protein n=1 Tax=Rothia kristinae TaxID=37923 RepID=A0A657IVS0_9MICC|nr:hypothetical protein A5N15_01605 [Rothia kristinae]
MTNHSSIESLRSATVYGSDGEKIGRVGEIYLDDQTDQPTFATVHTGLFGTKETFVPWTGPRPPTRASRCPTRRTSSRAPRPSTTMAR